jgi:hypothetical protein
MMRLYVLYAASPRYPAMTSTSLINNAARAAQPSSPLAYIAEILRWPFQKPLRAVLFLSFVAAWPQLITWAVALAHWRRSVFHG